MIIDKTGNMIHTEYTKKQNRIVSDFEDFQKKSIQDSIELNDKYAAKIEECMVDVEDYLQDKRVIPFMEFDSNILYYRYVIKSKDIQTFLDLDEKLNQYIGKHSYYHSVSINDEQTTYTLVPVRTEHDITIRYFFEKLTKKFLKAPDRHNDGDWH